MMRGRGMSRGTPMARGRGARSGRSSSANRREMNYGPPQNITAVGVVTHHCENELICESTLIQQVPFFNGRIFLENKQEIGKIDEVLGPLNKIMFSVTLAQNLKCTSFNPQLILYIDSRQIMPLSRFLPKAEAEKKAQTPKQNKRNVRGGLRGSINIPRRGVFSRGILSRGRGGS